MNHVRVSAEKTRAKTESLIRQRLEQLAPYDMPVMTPESLSEATATLLRELRVPESCWLDLNPGQVKYYKKRDIVSPPEGRTSNARYGARHVVELAIGRVCNQVPWITIREAADRLRRGADPVALLAEVCVQAWQAQQAGAVPSSPGRRDVESAAHPSEVVAARPAMRLAERMSTHSATNAAATRYSAPERKDAAGRTDLNQANGLSLGLGRAQKIHPAPARMQPRPAPAVQTAVVLTLSHGVTVHIPEDHPLLLQGETYEEIARVLEASLQG